MDSWKCKTGYANEEIMKAKRMDEEEKREGEERISGAARGYIALYSGLYHKMNPLTRSSIWDRDRLLLKLACGSGPRISQVFDVSSR